MNHFVREILIAIVFIFPLASYGSENDRIHLTQYEFAKLLIVSTPAFERSEVCATSNGVVACAVNKRITRQSVAVSILAGAKTLSISARTPEQVEAVASGDSGFYAVELTDDAASNMKLRVILRRDSGRTVYLGLRIMNVETDETLANAFDRGNLDKLSVR